VRPERPGQRARAGCRMDGRDHGNRGYSGQVPALLLLLALLILVLVWRFRSARKASGPQARPRFVAPDDDPDFLRDLDRRTRRDDDQP
jgi:hypothetical protein